MMAAILNSAMLDSDTAILDSDTLLSSLRFTQKHSHSTLMLTQTNSIWLKLIHSHLTWWWQPSWILPSWIWHLGFSHHSISSQTHSHLPRLVPTICTKKLHSFILTQLDDGSHLEFCHVGLRHCHLWFKHLVTHSLRFNSKMAAILNSAMLDSDTAILDSDTLLSSLRFPQKHSHSTLALTQTNSIWLFYFDDGSHLEFVFTHLFSLNLMISHLDFVGFRHCHLGTDTLLSDTQKLSLYSDGSQSDSNSFSLL